MAAKMLPNSKICFFRKKYKVTRRLPGGLFEVMWAKIHIFAVT